MFKKSALILGRSPNFLVCSNHLANFKNGGIQFQRVGRPNDCSKTLEDGSVGVIHAQGNNFANPLTNPLQRRFLSAGSDKENEKMCKERARKKKAERDKLKRKCVELAAKDKCMDDEMRKHCAKLAIKEKKKEAAKKKEEEKKQKEQEKICKEMAEEKKKKEAARKKKEAARKKKEAEEKKKQQEQCKKLEEKEQCAKMDKAEKKKADKKKED